MKFNLYKISWSFLSVMLLISCSKDSDLFADNYEDFIPDGGVQITVSDGGFVDMGDELPTRATQDGDNIKFESGDAIGITFFKDDGTVTLNNVKFVYDGAKWNTSSLIDDIKGATKYIASFPYNTAFNKKTKEADLLAASPLSLNQQSKEKYRAADIMSATGTASYNLNINLKHLRACISAKYEDTVYVFETDGMWTWEQTYSSYVATDPVNFWIYKSSDSSNTYGYGYLMEDNTYRFIIDPGTYADSFVGLFQTPLKRFDIANKSKTFQAGHRYHHNGGVYRPYDFQDIKTGDNIWQNGSNYFVTPGEIQCRPNWYGGGADLIATAHYVKEEGSKKYVYMCNVPSYLYKYYENGEWKRSFNISMYFSLCYYTNNPCAFSGSKNDIEQVSDNGLDVTNQCLQIFKTEDAQLYGRAFYDIVTSWRNDHNVAGSMNVSGGKLWYIPTGKDIKDMRNANIKLPECDLYLFKTSYELQTIDNKHYEGYYYFKGSSQQYVMHSYFNENNDALMPMLGVAVINK